VSAALVEARPIRKAKPSIGERAREAICPECGGPVVRRSSRGPVPTFCSPEHKKAFGNRQLVEGRAVIGLLKGWRIERGSGPIASAAFAQVCSILDGFNAADREVGRPRADLYAAKLLADGSIYADRRRVR
jgi:hypothetical protein